MAAPGTLYDVLGCVPGASSGELRRAYLAALPTAHPDRGGSAEAFSAVQRAWAVLSDAVERAAYDDRLATWEEGPPGAGHGPRVVHHGQTAPRQPQRVYRPPPRASAHSTSEAEAALDAAVREACEAFEACHDSPPERAAAGQRLCRAHAARAAHAEAAGRLHHALFDAREAARLSDAAGRDGLQALIHHLEGAVHMNDLGGGDDDDDDDGSLDGAW
ncbi:hypothetical protein ACKKBG_A38865 [Auxenochlorella protothecoides x Auxenochlorella symbiontica]